MTFQSCFKFGFCDNWRQAEIWNLPGRLRWTLFAQRALRLFTQWPWDEHPTARMHVRIPNTICLALRAWISDSWAWAVICFAKAFFSVKSTFKTAFFEHFRNFPNLKKIVYSKNGWGNRLSKFRHEKICWQSLHEVLRFVTWDVRLDISWKEANF